jgi:hypothetical protein
VVNCRGVAWAAVGGHRQPGAGKSAVVARAALALETEHHGWGLAFHARAATITDFLTALTDLTGVEAFELDRPAC